MTMIRIALANIPFAATPEESITLTIAAIDEAARQGAVIVCFPECYVPGYRGPGKRVPASNPEILQQAWSTIASATAKAGITVILGTERGVDGGASSNLIGGNSATAGQPGAEALAGPPRVIATALVINPDGSIAGFQDKVQLDPSEEAAYTPGTDRRLFQAGPLTFGIVICHEGWRYPETVRWAARRGAQVVFHPQFHEAEPDSYRPTAFADPNNSFHEKAALCRAAENTCYFATVNYASPGSPTTSAVVRPDGTLQCYQPYGEEGLLIADIDLGTATGLLAERCRTVP